MTGRSPSVRHDRAVALSAARPGGHPQRGYLETGRRIGVWPDSVQVLGETLSLRGCPPAGLVWLSHGVRPRRAPREERLERGLSALEVAMPSPLDITATEGSRAMGVIIGMDPHKRSATIEVVD